uniref:Uncharacterized protein n=1 Tax=Globodera rostochiensis TaxID=31243 RepID=A0A914HL74_GLORO
MKSIKSETPKAIRKLLKQNLKRKSCYINCKKIQCADGFQCQVRISISKLGDLPYDQSIGTFPQCVSLN